MTYEQGRYGLIQELSQITAPQVYSVHKLASLMPPMNDGEYVALKNDIAQNELLHPIVIFEGQVLDGRHRYSACVELGVPIITVVSDMHYRNEAQAIRHRGGVLIRIERPGVGPINDHISEHDLDGWTDWDATN